MLEERFWRTTPRKLYALLDAHIQANDPEQGKKQAADPKTAVKAIMKW
jgi:hypothetical protein